jgi:hypothetical protein
MPSTSFNYTFAVAGTSVLLQLLLSLTVLDNHVPTPTYPGYPVSEFIPSVIPVTPTPLLVDPDLNYLSPTYLHDTYTVALQQWTDVYGITCKSTCDAVSMGNDRVIISFQPGDHLNFTGLTNIVYCFNPGAYYLSDNVQMNNFNYFIGCPKSIVYVVTPNSSISYQLISTPRDYVYLKGMTYDFSQGNGFIGQMYAQPLDHLVISNCTFANAYFDYPIISLNNVSLIYDNLFYNVSYALGPSSGGGAHSVNIYNNLFYNVNNHVDLGWFGESGYQSHFMFNNNTIIVDDKLIALGYNQIVNLEGHVFAPMQIRNNRVSCQGSCPNWFVVNQAGDFSWACPVGNFTLGWITNNTLISNVSTSNWDTFFSDFGPLTAVIVKNNTFEIVGNSHRGFPFALETISSVWFANNTFIGNSLGNQMNPYGSGGNPSQGYNVCGGVVPIESMNTFGTNYFYNTVSQSWLAFNGTDYAGGTQWPPSVCGKGGTFVPCCHPFTPLAGQAACRCGSIPYYGGDLTIACNLPGEPPSNLQLSYYFGNYFGLAFTALNADFYSILINGIRKDRILTNYAVINSVFNLTIPPTGPLLVDAVIFAVNKFGEISGTISFYTS